VLAPEAQAAEHPLDTVLVLVPAGQVESLLGFGIAGHRFRGVVGVRHLLGQGQELVLLATQRSKYGQHLVVEGAPAVELGALRQIAHAQPAGTMHAPVTGLIEAQKEAQQGCLAGAVGADQRDLVAMGDAQADAGKDVLRAV